LIGHIPTPGIGGGGSGGIAAIFVSHFSCGTQIPEKRIIANNKLNVNSQ
jgi:hypothetical protein